MSKGHFDEAHQASGKGGADQVMKEEEAGKGGKQRKRPQGKNKANQEDADGAGGHQNDYGRKDLKMQGGG